MIERSLIESSDFAVHVDGVRVDSATLGIVHDRTEERNAADDKKHLIATYLYEPASLVIESHLIRYMDTTLVERWVVLHNESEVPVTIGRVDSFSLQLPLGDWSLMHYTSDWGAEFEPVVEPLAGETIVLETRHGRSSKGKHPWMSLLGASGEVLTVSPMWSGNWQLRCEYDKARDSYEVNGGLSDWEFFKTLAPGEAMESVHVAIAAGSDGDLNSTSIAFARVGRKYWYPHNEFSRSMPMEWNHWWSYEDKAINEDVFRANAAEAAKLGIDICTLDAGWFGPSEEGSEWFELRGDWEMVNEKRFPSGIRAVSDDVHGHGMKFGLWCEIEAVGKSAALAEKQPSYVARRDGEPLGYLCFGNPKVRQWALDMLDRLIAGYDSQWIKLDFNLDPGAGCNCTDHGHGAGDGLFEHYNGYYSVLRDIRAKHPEVILENCSSGGLRIDLGIMQQTHTTFLSDPDYPEHSLQVFWGATTMLAPDVCLHWSYSEFCWKNDFQLFNPHDVNLKPYQFDYYTRIAMLRGFGISQKLPEMPEWMKARLAHHIEVYKSEVKPFVLGADLYRLTGQPRRGGKGDRWSGFQYSMPQGDEQLLFVFRLPGGEASRAIRLQALEMDAAYELTWLSGEGKKAVQLAGSSLLKDGIVFDSLEVEESALIRLKKL
ncbi:alpha-galactosidase [Paenibacillus albus]|uniref:alpha-galactosidase n=1 Tax=Paenibacillus albus TaxID=2495582 RepID=A0A3S9A2P2_9BACL|nr:alpha-galactosidase [Paenibacillus albus]AZN39989.1 alpha-galactosidase [Paenibacillus albus]